jgi:hypothetical protein
MENSKKHYRDKGKKPDYYTKNEIICGLINYNKTVNKEDKYINDDYCPFEICKDSTNI